MLKARGALEAIHAQRGVVPLRGVFLEVVPYQVAMGNVMKPARRMLELTFSHEIKRRVFHEAEGILSCTGKASFGQCLPLGLRKHHPF